MNIALPESIKRVITLSETLTKLEKLSKISGAYSNAYKVIDGLQKISAFSESLEKANSFQLQMTNNKWKEICTVPKDITTTDFFLTTKVPNVKDFNSFSNLSSIASITEKNVENLDTAIAEKIGNTLSEYIEFHETTTSHITRANIEKLNEVISSEFFHDSESIWSKFFTYSETVDDVYRLAKERDEAAKYLKLLKRILKSLNKIITRFSPNRREIFRRMQCFLFKNLDDTDSVLMPIRY